MILTKKNNGNKMFMQNNSDMTRTHNAGLRISQYRVRFIDTLIQHEVTQKLCIF